MYKRVTLAGTFNAEPIIESMLFWQARLGLGAEFRITPSNQILQQLMYPDSLLRTNTGANVLLVRLSDWMGNGHGAGQQTPNPPEATLDNFAKLMKEAVEEGRATYVVVLCPEAPENGSDPNPSALSPYQGYFREICSKYARILDGLSIADRYHSAQIHDPSSGSLLGIPYCRAYFAALGTEIIRVLVSLEVSRPKLIAFDCDGTLWRGNCGESSPDELEVNEDHRLLQEFLVGCQQRGTTLSICSKNDLPLVQSVFQSRADMPLREEHVSSWKVNWHPKSRNIRELAAEFGCSYDSIVFVDDELFQCEEVRADCPGVLAFHLSDPFRHSVISLCESWLFDISAITKEDRLRSQFYAQDKERQAVRQDAGDLERFLQESQLQVEIRPFTDSDIDRVSQLSFRVTQLNTSCETWNRSDLARLSAAPSFLCRTVQVKDRFGDYGVVGAFILEINPPASILRSMLLSCRALGRFVEDTMMAEIAKMARDKGCTDLRIQFRKTARNGPTQQFLSSLGAQVVELDKPYLRISVGDLWERREKGRRSFGYVMRSPSELPLPNSPAPNRTDLEPGHPSSISKEAVLSLTGELRTAEEIIEACRRGLESESDADSSSPEFIESMLLRVWKKVLQQEEIGIDDDIFALGADSLATVQILNAVNQILDIALPLSIIFESDFSVRNIKPLCVEALRLKSVPEL